jgi:hypothetical protein
LNPGYIEPTPFYQTTDPVQSQYFYGSHGFQEGPTFDATRYNQAPAPETPFGLQQMYRPLTFDQINDLIAGGTLAKTPAAPARRSQAARPLPVPPAYTYINPAAAAAPAAPRIVNTPRGRGYYDPVTGEFIVIGSGTITNPLP